MKTLLIVHSDPDVGYLLRSILGVDESLVSIATDYYSIEEFLQTNQYSAVLTDINIDGISRIEYLKRLKSFFKEDAIFLLSEMDQKEMLSEAKDLGLKQFLDFPISIEELQNTMKSVIC